MRQWHLSLWPPPWSQSTLLGQVATSVYFLALIPIVAVLCVVVLLVKPFEWWFTRGKPPRMTRRQVADEIDAFLAGRGGAWDWDDFCCVPIRDPELDAIRERCAQLHTEYPPELDGQYCGPGGIAVMREYVDKLRRSDG